VANELRDAARSLSDLTEELKRAGVGRPSAAELRRESTPTELASTGSRDLENALSSTAGELRGLGAGFGQSAKAIQEGFASLGRSLPGFSNSALGGLASGGGFGSLLKSGFGLAPLALSVAKLIGGGGSEDSGPTFEQFEAAAPLNLSAANVTGPLQGLPQAVRGTGSEVRSVPQVVVNVSAMDSQGFMDRSDDIARAVRSAMLHMHPLNDVVDEI
jgi:hypothetical protein